ncbi:Tat pathway signal protein [Nodosilinea sp. LEGE 07298]|uniref:Tat pathway signal protein n=1 Tax=Nodosilinea sp. LEGE 07298 TaxID=2777970 RepID=UPI0018821ED7|nr:Tat pathway signal protein [Nodosilinea sp. LEGE 07298]MBE9112305.1 Tat pathway signal protein [Nodosilinea sp. LEGE 07298]
MSINRRQFNRLALFGGASLASQSYSFFFPKPAEAYNLDFSLRDFSTGQVFTRLQRLSAARPVPGVLTPILQGGAGGGQIESGAANVIRRADQGLQRNNFIQSRTELARAGTGTAASSLWGRQRQEGFGNNVGFAFIQNFQGDFSDARLSGPTMTGIHNAQPVLSTQRLSPLEIAGSTLPVRSTFDALGGWEGDNGSGVAFQQYRTALGMVTTRYDLRQPGRGGFGDVQMRIEAYDQPTRVISVRVRFT